jgi:Zn/Cd-binding protein ZinT
MKKKVLILIVFILLILFTQIDGIKYMISDMIYFARANEDYVSKKYSINVENMSHTDKNYAFWGTKESTNELKYVIFVFRKGIYCIDGNEGISEERAKEIAYDHDVLPFYIGLNVTASFQEGKSIVDYMYWVIEYEDSSLKYIRFSDGIEENPFG